MDLCGTSCGLDADLSNVIHPINSGPLELRAQMGVALSHHDGFVTQDALEDIEVAARHHPVRGEGVPQIVEVQV